MLIPSLTPLEWALALASAALVGFSKTGVPGTGILVVPLMAALFGGRESVGTLLPMLIFADCFAVAWYRRHARWDRLWALIPWVLAGMALGAGTLQMLGPAEGSRDRLSILIGVLVLVMLALSLARGRWGERLVPHSRAGSALTGVAAGFATAVSNAAGPVMSLYFLSAGLNKSEFMGSFAWYFFIFNLIKVPIFAALTAADPQHPMFSASSLTFNLLVAPMIAVGAVAGRWLLPRIPQKVFDNAVLVLAAAAALRLILG